MYSSRVLHLSDGAEAGREVAVAPRGGLRMVLAGDLAAPQHVEGGPEDKVFEHVQVDMAVAAAVHQDVLLVLRPLLQLLPII